MKTFRDILTGLLLATGLIVGLSFLHAQETGAPIQTRSASAFSFATNSLWLQIIGVTNDTAYLILNNTTDEVYEVWSKTDLTLTNWNIESEIWPTNPAMTPFTVPLLDRTNALFIWARDWTGVTGSGNTTPDWWFWKYFGTLALSDTDLDSQGNTLLYDYQNGVDPNIILFSLNFANEYVNRHTTSGTITILGGVPAYRAVLVNDTNLANADWQPYTSNLEVNLNAGDGNYNLLVGLRGLSPDARQTWLNAQLILDTVPPVLTVTNPATGTVSQPMIQLQGYANESLGALTFDVSNAAGIWTNQTAYMTSQFYDTNLLAFTTNWFQCYDVALTNGLDSVALHATDLAGNTTTANFDVTLDYTGDTTPPRLTVIWPQDRTHISGSSFTLQAQVDDATAKIAATIIDSNNNTNTIQGLVERNGTVLAQNLPLSGGTNWLTIVAKDAAGNASTTCLALFQSDVALTLNPLPSDQLNSSSVNVYGTVGDPTVAVYVNGVQASVNVDGTWEADAVSPNSSCGTAFNVQAGVDTDHIVASQTFYQPHPVIVCLKSYTGHQHRSFEETFFCLDPGKIDGYDNDTIGWDSKTGGLLQCNGNSTQEGDEGGPYNYSQNLPAGDGMIFPPWEYANTPVIWIYNVQCESIRSYGQRYTETHVMIKPQDQASAMENELYLVRAAASEISDPAHDGFFGSYGYLICTDPWWWYGDSPLPPEWLQIRGQTLVNSGIMNEDDGSVWGETIVSAPAGVNVDVTPVATRVHRNWDYTFDVQADEANLQLAVDNNRDGNITFDAADATSTDKPYRFWVNNDYDGYDPGIGDYADLDPAGGSDANNLAISCTRDLEDYTRLWVNTQGITRELLDGTFLLALEWKDVTDDPKIQFFQAAEADGGARYLFDADTAQQQYANYGTHLIEWAHRNVLTKDNPYIFPSSFWTRAGVSTNQPVVHLLFDAVSRGSGQLVISIYKNDGVTKLAESQPLCLKLQDVKEMYERWTVGDGNGGAPATTATPSMRLPPGVTTPFQYNSSSPEENEYILFVHGWNLAPWERDAYAETAFKRLYWQGYKGHFGAFQWPTEYGFGSWKTVATDPDNYDNSEFNAWSSGAGLLGLLNRLNSSYPGNVYLMAHSMGNVAAGEALKLAGANQVVNTYIAMQAAVPAHCYDQIADFRTIPLLLDSGTPDRYANYPTNNGPCYFNGTAGAGSYINFYNANDWALAADHWQLDQDLKPDRAFFYNGINFFAGTCMLSLPQDTYQIFAYCDEARCYALGAQANVAGAFKVGAIYQQIDLSQQPYNFNNLHKDHSGEFNSDNMNRSQFWDEVLSQMKLK